MSTTTWRLAVAAEGIDETGRTIHGDIGLGSLAEHGIASIDSTGGVPLSSWRMPCTGAYSGPIAKMSAAPHHPWIGCSTVPWCSARR